MMDVCRCKDVCIRSKVWWFLFQKKSSGKVKLRGSPPPTEDSAGKVNVSVCLSVCVLAEGRNH